MASGFCGEGLMWWIEGGDTLIISGTGKMKNYFFMGRGGANSPWHNFHNEIKKVIIYDGVTSIGDAAFSWCIRLKEIKIPVSIKSIGDSAFWFCNSLKEIRIPDGVTSIDDSVFRVCESLTEIKIPDGVTSIGDYAFCSCKNLKKIKIPDGITSIGYSAFSYCKSLTEIKIPASITFIGEEAFHDCYGLTEIKIPDGTAKIGKRTFQLCTNLKSITIPDSVTSIGDWAFDACRNLTEIKIPDSVTKVGNAVFDGCEQLKEIYYPAGRGFERNLSAGNNAKLIPYTIAPPAQVKPSLPAVKAKPARESPKSANERKFFPVVEPAPEKLRWKVEGKKLTVGGVREIKFYSYGELPWVDSVDAIQHIVIEAGVEKISANAFSECKRLELLTIPASVKTIGDCAFTFCYCGNRDVNGGKNVIWSLDDGVLTFKKNPSVRNAADFSIGAVSWRAVDKNITGVKIERGVIPDKKFFDWRKSLSRDVPVSM